MSDAELIDAIADKQTTKIDKQRKDNRVYKVAIDDGLAQMKLFGESPKGSGFIQDTFPSGIKSASTGTILDLAGGTVGMYITEENEKFVCTYTTKSEETRFPDFHVSQIDRVLIHHALLKAGYGGKKVELLTALPVDEFYQGTSVNAERIGRKKANLLKRVTAVDSDIEMAEIVEVKVGCQAIAAFFDYVYTDKMKLIEEIPESAAVIDIGGSTTDIAVILEGKVIDFAKSGAARIGVLDIHTMVKNRIEKKVNADSAISFSIKQIDTACRTKSIMLYGQKVDITQEVDDVAADVSAEILREINRKIGSGATLDQIILVGGGSAFLKDHLKGWPHAFLAKDSELSNARGLLKFELSKSVK